MSADVERVKLQREAFEAGAAWQGESAHRSHYQSYIGDTRDEAARRYPMPSVTVPRVREDRNRLAWRVVDGEIEWKMTDVRDVTWKRIERPGSLATPVLSVERVRILADLLASPTVTVPADEAAP